MLLGSDMVAGGPAPTWPSEGVRQLFFALQPDTESASAIHSFAESLRRRHRLRGRLIEPDRLHITLTFLGAAAGAPPPELVRRFSTLAASVAGRPFRVELDHVQNWAEKRNGAGPVVLVGGDKTIGVDLLHEALVRTLALAGLRKEKVITPHMTLMWDVVGAVADRAGPFTWTAREFLLVESFYGDSRYEIRGRFPLGG